MAEGFTCKVGRRCRSACEDLPQYQETGYCILHYPDEEKNKEAFEKVKKSKLDRKDYDFGGTIFPEGTSDFKGFEFDAAANFARAIFLGAAHFSEAKFSGQRTHFSRAKFSGAETYFSDVQFSGERTDFSRAKFSGRWTYFSDAQFSGERTDFSRAKFSGQRTHFSRAKFSGERTDFSDAQFSGEWTKFSDAQFSGAETYFQEATFMKEVDFTGATFKERASFWGSKANRVFGCGAWAWFNGSRIEKPEQFTFNSVLLHPGWFINNADVRKVDFTDVEWYGMPGGLEGTLAEEIDKLKELRVESPHTLLAQACRRLSANAEENREYPLANEFHYWSMDALRKESWSHFKSLTLRGLKKKETWRDIGEHFGLITTLYWALSGYGVRAARAFWTLFAIWLLFAAVYFLLGESTPFWVFSASNIWEGIDYARQAAVYSLSALVRLNPRPQSEGLSWFQTLVTVEGILGPLQIALLVLAVRRKVMR